MRRGWLVAWGLGSAVVGGASLLVPVYVVELGGGPGTLGVLAAVAAFAGVPGALGAGRVATTPARIRAVVLAALAGILLVLVAMPLTRSIALVVGANGVVWFAFAAATPVVTLLAVHDAPEPDWARRIAEVNKYQGVGWAVGLLLGAAWTLLTPLVLPEPVVVRGLFLVLALVGLSGLLAGFLWFPGGEPTKQLPRPGRIARAVQRADRFSVRTATFPFTLGRADYRSLHPRQLADRYTPRLARYYAAVAVFFMGFAVFFAPLPAFLGDAGFGWGAVFGLYLASSLAAAAAFEWAGDLATTHHPARLQAIGLTIRGLAFPLVGLLALAALAPGLALGTLLFLVIGLTWAVIAVTGGTLITRLSPPLLRGEALGVYAALGAVAGGLGGILGGWLATTSYPLAFTTAGLLVLTAATITRTLPGRH